MKPLRLRVKNFIGLREIDISFEGKGLFAIQGPNGAGKSSLLEAIYFALFNKTLRHGAKCEGVVNRLSQDGKAVVDFEFLHHGKRWRIKREVELSSTGRTRRSVYLECLDTSERVTSAREASIKIEKLIGLTDKTFKTTVLLPQGEITSFLELTPGERMKVLRELLSGERLSRMVELLNLDLREKEGAMRAFNAQLSTIDVKSLKEEKARISPELSRLEEELKLVQCDLMKLEGEISTLRKLEETLRELEMERQLLRSAEERRDRVLQRMEEIEGKLKEIEAKRGRLSASLEEINKLCEVERKLVSELESLRIRLIPLKSEISSISRELEKHLKKIHFLNLDLNRCSKRIKEEKIRFDKLNSDEEKLRREYEIKRERYFILELRKSLKVGGVCPLCGAEVRSIPEINLNVRSEELRRLKKAWDKALKDVRESNGVLSALEKEKEEKLRLIKEISAEVESLKRNLLKKEERLNRLNSLWRERLGGESDIFPSIEDAFEARRKKLEGIEKEREELRRAFETLKASERALLEERERLSLEITDLERDINFKKAKVSRMEEKIKTQLTLPVIRNRLEKLEEKVEELRSREASLKESIWKAKSRIEAIDGEIKNYSFLKEKVDELEKEVHLLSELNKCLWDSNFPKFLVSRYLFEAAEIANSYLLRLTRGRFSIEATEGLELFVLDEDLGGERKSIKDLSGGERVLVSLSLALGIAEVLAGGLEAFFIDEGFSPLDRENLGMVAHELLELDRTGKVVGIITHDPVFADYFPEKLLVRSGMAEWA